jgi:hypothetical protein
MLIGFLVLLCCWSSTGRDASRRLFRIFRRVDHGQSECAGFRRRSFMRDCGTRIHLGWWYKCDQSRLTH